MTLSEQFRPNQGYNTNRGVVFLLNGPPKSGKNTLADNVNNTMKDVYGFSFAEPIKHIVGQILYGSLHVTARQLATIEAHKEEVGFGSLMGKSPRDLMIAVSESLIKPMMGADYFGQVALMRLVYLIEKHDAAFFISSDSGFLAETLPLIKFFGQKNIFVINLIRDGYEFKNDSRAYLSPDLFPHEECPRFFSLTNNGTIEAAQHELKTFIFDVMADFTEWRRCL